MLRFSLSNERGIAIIAVAMVMTVVVLLGGAIIVQTSQDVQLTDRTYEQKQALYFAESAKERAYREIMNDYYFTTLGTDGVVSNVPVGGGTYDLTATTLSETPNKVVRVVGTGTAGQTVRDVTVVAEIIRVNVNPWNNAIFGGGGQAGGVIDGNAAIHGSVHLLGENVGSGNNSLDALDLSGTALIHNNYEGMPAGLLAKVPALPTTVFGGETVETLNTKLRVKNGAVGVNGNSEIGEMNVVGNGWKETLDGIYIETDATETRWTGNQVSGGVPEADNVQSDNGTNALYDLGNMVQMPDLNEAYTDATGTNWGSYESYFSANALHLPALTLDNSSDAASLIAGTVFPGGVTVSINGDGFEITDGSNTLKYDPTPPAGTANVTITGMVQVDGDLVIGENGFNMTYSGRGTIYSSASGGDPGNIDIHSNFISLGTFPTDDVIGLMAKNEMNLATGPGDAQLTLTGAFYSNVQTTSSKQNHIAGTFVCQYFDMGTNVPRIYQVPELINNLPPGLIGSDPIWVVTGFQERSWRVD